MSESPEVIQTVIDGRASRLAFQIGQTVERLLVDQAVKSAVSEKAAPERKTTVTAAHVQRVLDQSLLREACTRIGIAFHGKKEPRGSRSVAG